MSKSFLLQEMADLNISLLEADWRLRRGTKVHPAMYGVIEAVVNTGKLSQVECAYVLDCSQSRISEIMNGGYRIEVAA